MSRLRRMRGRRFTKSKTSPPGERIVGWYHSHPGFGVFLSEHDTFIHRNFFSSPDHVAWVYDPHTDEEGCFGWVDSDIHRISHFSIADNNGDGVERTPKQMEPVPESEEERPVIDRRQRRRGERSAWLRLGVTALAYLSAIVLGFAIAFFLFPRPILVEIDPATGDLVQVPSELIRRIEQHPGVDSGGNAPSRPASPPQQTKPPLIRTLERTHERESATAES